MKWEVSLGDIRQKLKLRYGYESALIFQQFQNLAVVVSKALGGSKEEKDQTPANIEQATAQLSAVFGKMNG